MCWGIILFITVVLMLYTRGLWTQGDWIQCLLDPPPWSFPGVSSTLSSTEEAAKDPTTAPRSLCGQLILGSAYSRKPHAWCSAHGQLAAKTPGTVVGSFMASLVEYKASFALGKIFHIAAVSSLGMAVLYIIFCDFYFLKQKYFIYMHIPY